VSSSTDLADFFTSVVVKKNFSSPFARKTSDSVAALGEEKLIVAIRRWLGDASPRAPFGIGDDCAVLPAARGP
jgi:thiamine-monophosphate kinase